ncbi:MAG: type I-MYXAN CRISPR-associated endonuclease Cas1 [Pseudanabaenaceae cyanobacterium]
MVCLTSSSLDLDTIRVSSLHALAYCERLFFLEEVEELYTQDAAVFAGRRLHVQIGKQEGEEYEELFLESSELGLRGKVDVLRTIKGELIPYEHKRGKPARDDSNKPIPWDSDRLQILAYAYLIESALEQKVREGRIRYHADNVLVKVPFDDSGREEVRQAIHRARELRKSLFRPPVTSNERLCLRCSLAPVCLPEEARLTHNREWQPVRLFPEDDNRRIIHILEPGTKVGKAGEQIKITQPEGLTELVPSQEVSQIVLHGFVQISTQAVHSLVDKEIGIHFISSGGRYVGSLDTRSGSIQRRIRQYQALSDPDFCLSLAKRLVFCRAEGQRKFLMRGRRNKTTSFACLDECIDQMRDVIQKIDRADKIDSLLGYEGNLAALYFKGLSHLLVEQTDPEMHFDGRNRRPPTDRFNALLSFGYTLLLKDMVNAILVVGLEPALGFYHQPRTQAPPLALDLMEIFRVPLVDMIVISSINRQQWHVKEDFEVRGNQVWLSDAGKRKFVALYEKRKEESWKHPILGYSLTYRRLMELEVQLLEKEWSGETGLFANLILR